MSDSGYDAFVSYRRSDGSAAARWVRTSLQHYQPPHGLRDRYGRHLRVYLDTAYERGTADFYGRTIRPALMVSRWLIIVATPNAVSRGEDDWIQREVRDFCAGPNGNNVIVVRGKGDFNAPLPADLETRFPQVQIVDLRRVGRFWFLNPLTASRISNELLKLVASVLEVEPGDMPTFRQEEERRQQTRLGFTFGGATAAGLAVMAFAVFALVSRYQTQTALQDSIYSLSQLVRQSHAEPILSQASAGESGQIAARGCDLLSNLDGTAGRRVPVGTRALCLVVQGDGRLEQREFDLAETNYRAALDVVTEAMARKPDEQLANMGLHARIALIRLYRAQKDSTGQINAIGSYIAECKRLFKATAPTHDNKERVQPFYEDRVTLYRRIGIAQQWLAELAEGDGNKNVRIAHLTSSSAAFADAVSEAQAMPTGSTRNQEWRGSVADLQLRQARVEETLAKVADHRNAKAIALHHIDRAIALRQAATNATGSTVSNELALGRLKFDAAILKGEPDGGRVLLDEARQHLSGALKRGDIRLSQARLAHRLLRRINGKAPKR